MKFTPGQPMDVALLTEMMSFPKVATLKLPHNTGSSSGVKIIPLEDLEDRDNIGITQLDSTTIELPVGEYFFDIPVKFYMSTGCSSYLHNLTTGETIQSSYAHPGKNTSMDNAIIKIKREFTEPTQIQVRVSSATNQHYLTYCSITQLR